MYTANFDKKYKNTTNPTACRTILEIFKNFFRFYEYVTNYAEDQRRVKINNAGYVTIKYFVTATFNKKTKFRMIEFDGHKLVTAQQLEEEKRMRSGIIDLKAENTFLK